jgi:hypothetical protein
MIGKILSLKARQCWIFLFSETLQIGIPKQPLFSKSVRIVFPFRLTLKGLKSLEFLTRAIILPISAVQ